jgi:uncharacterized protein (TIGR00369 family)
VHGGIVHGGIVHGGIVHGGYFFTLLDSAAGCAVHTTLPAGTGFTTLELKINFIRTLTTDAC